MKLVNPMKMIYKARENGCAIASFNVHNLETIQAVAEGAMEEGCPVIIQTTPGTIHHVGLPYIVSMVQTAAEVYDILIALHVDHCSDYETIMQCIRYGYTSVMMDASHLPYHENVAMVKKVVDAAHSAGVAVEGEIGRIGGVEEDRTATAAFTVPDEASDFVEQTGVDMLAIAIGTAHGIYKGEPTLEFTRLSEIRKVVDVPKTPDGIAVRYLIVGIHTAEVRKGAAVYDLGCRCFVSQIIQILQQVQAQHQFQIVGLVAALSFVVARLYH